MIFLVCIEHPESEASAVLPAFEKERKALADGKKPAKTRDFEQWKEETFDFPKRFGEFCVYGFSKFGIYGC